MIEDARVETLLVPVPLNRGRLWQRGFNQSAIVARELFPPDWAAEQRDRSEARPAHTPLKGDEPAHAGAPLRGRSRSTIAARSQGATVVLVDDVLTTGSTANACARELRRSGAARVELVSWPRGAAFAFTR